MFSHYTIKVSMMFVMAVILVNLVNYIFYVYYNPSSEALSVRRHPIGAGISQLNSLNDPFPDHLGIRSNAENLCPAIPPELGPVSYKNPRLRIAYPIEIFYSVLKGLNTIESCVPRERVAIIVPMPASEAYPKKLAEYLHSFLRKQMLEYELVVVKQSATSSFQRGRLINAAVTELLKVQRKPIKCVIIHDSDILPVDTRNIYRCGWYPRQLVTKVCKPNNKETSYESTFGGAIAFTPDQFEKANGFSNTYENNAVFVDMAKRFAAASYVIDRTPSVIGEFISLQIFETTENATTQNSVQSSLKDGLNSLKYLVEEYEPAETSYLQIRLTETETHMASTSPPTSKAVESSSEQNKDKQSLA